MKLLTPSNMILLESNVPVDEAQIFTHRVYTEGELAVYDNALWKRLAGSDVFDAFVADTFYTESMRASYNSVNYICHATVANDAPDVDTSRWSALTPAAWDYSNAYAKGAVVTYDGGYYYCIAAHTSAAVDDFKDWKYGEGSAYYAPGGCIYNGKYYKLNSGFLPGYTASRSVPTSPYITDRNIWYEVTTVALQPAVSSHYWIEMTHQEWNGIVMYKQDAAVLYSGTYYKCTADITMPTPDTDISRWYVASGEIPELGSTVWEYRGAVNRMKMFDKYLTTSTVAESTLQMTISPESFDALYLGNLFADEVRVEVIDNADDSVIEDYTEEMFIEVASYKEYFFGDWINKRQKTFVYERTTLTKDVSLRLTITGDTIMVGICAVGKTEEVGATLWGFSESSLDYSMRVKDPITGETYLEQGNEVSEMSGKLFVSTKSVGVVKEIVRESRGKPVFFYDILDMTRIYCFVRKREVLVNGPEESIISLEVEGLI